MRLLYLLLDDGIRRTVKECRNQTCCLLGERTSVQSYLRVDATSDRLLCRCDSLQADSTHKPMPTFIIYLLDSPSGTSPFFFFLNQLHTSQYNPFVVSHVTVPTKLQPWM